MKAKRYTLIFFIVALFIALLTESLFSAEGVSVVEGLIQDVTADSIQVRERYYNISGVPLKDASDRTLTRASLISGKKVEIFFKDGRITSVLIHEYMVE